MTDNDIEKYFLSLYKKLLNVKYDLKITRNEFLALNSVHDLLKRQREEIDKLKVREITCECDGVNENGKNSI